MSLSNVRNKSPGRLSNVPSREQPGKGKTETWNLDPCFLAQDALPDARLAGRRGRGTGAVFYGLCVGKPERDVTWMDSLWATDNPTYQFPVGALEFKSFCHLHPKPRTALCFHDQHDFKVE